MPKRLLAMLFVLGAPLADADVHRDCFAGQWSLSCRKDRVQDAKKLDVMFSSVIAQAGWQRGCFEVEYVKGNDGGSDAILVVLHGGRSGSGRSCRYLPYEPDERRRPPALLGQQS